MTTTSQGATGTRAHAPGVPDVDAVVIGAGMSGLYMLHRLRELGLSVQGFEAGDGVGGTWYWNRYPGARCDSESHIYSYSFSPKLQREWQWSSTYPDQPEILAYLEHVADRLDLRGLIRFDTPIQGASFDTATATWRVVPENGEPLTTRFLISAVGCLTAANVPDVPGRECFTGRSFHSSDWPREGVDFTGRRVGVIGTGATGIQIIPSIAPEAGHLTVFQRTANYSVPAANTPLSPQTWREFQQHYDAIRARTRETFACFTFDIGAASARTADAEERERTYESDWNQGGIKFVFGSDYGDLLFDQEANETAAEFVRRKIRTTVLDPETAETLCPRTHPIGTKRPPVDTLGYYETFNRENVDLVDLREEPIEEITENGIRVGAREIPLDDLVFATGFDAFTGGLLRMDLRGESGLSLAEAWAQGPRTYLGLAVPGFPNLFTITGPGSPSVLSNMVVSIEQHVDWIARCVDHLRRHGLDRIEATEAAQQRWGEHTTEVADATLLHKGASWWRGANVDGKPVGLMPYAGGAAAYRAECDNVAAQGYTGFATEALTPAAP